MASNLYVKSVTLRGSKINYIPSNYNTNINLETSVVTQRVAEQAIENLSSKENFEFNSQHQLNIISDSVLIDEFKNDFATDKIYKLKFQKVSDTTATIASDFTDKVTVDEVYIPSKLKTDFEEFELINTSTEKISVTFPDNVTKVRISEDINFIIVTCNSDLELYYPNYTIESLVDNNTKCILHIDTTPEKYFGSNVFKNTDVKIKCKEIFISSRFFKYEDLSSAEVGDFGDFSNITIEKIHIERDGLNTSLEKNELITRLKEILNINSDIIELF